MSVSDPGYFPAAGAMQLKNTEHSMHEELRTVLSQFVKLSGRRRSRFSTVSFRLLSLNGHDFIGNTVKLFPLGFRTVLNSFPLPHVGDHSFPLIAFLLAVNCQGSLGNILELFPIDFSTVWNLELTLSQRDDLVSPQLPFVYYM